MKIIIIGAGGHVGKSLTYEFESLGFEVLKYNRTLYDGFLPLSSFRDAPESDILINCLGVGTPQKEKEYGTSLVDLELTWNNNCLYYIKKYPECHYFYFSSGVANPKYKNDSIYSRTKVYIEDINNSLNSNTHNLRLYSYFTRFIDIDNTQFLPSIIRAIKNRETLYVNRTEIIRDYIHPLDIMKTILHIMKYCNKMKVSDLSSGLPISKKEVLSYFSDNYNLKWKYLPFAKKEVKSIYVPERMCLYNMTSIDTIKKESKFLLSEFI